MTTHGFGVSFGGDEMCWNLIVVMFAQVSDYIKNYQILHFKRVDFILCECVNKTKPCTEYNEDLIFFHLTRRQWNIEE